MCARAYACEFNRACDHMFRLLHIFVRVFSNMFVSMYCTLMFCTPLCVFSSFLCVFPASNMPWHELTIRSRDNWRHSVSASNRNLKRCWILFLGAVLAKLAKSKPVGANLLRVWTFHRGKYFRCPSCKMWQKKFNWIRGRLLVGGYLNINIPIMESGAGSGHGKVRGPRSAAHTRFKSCCNSFHRENKISRL